MAFLTQHSLITTLAVTAAVGVFAAVAFAAMESWLEQLRKTEADERLKQETSEISKVVTQDGLTTLHAFNICEAIRRVRQESGESSVKYDMHITLPDGRKGTITLGG